MAKDKVQHLKCDKMSYNRCPLKYKPRIGNYGRNTLQIFKGAGVGVACRKLHTKEVVDLTKNEEPPIPQGIPITQEAKDVTEIHQTIEVEHREELSILGHG